MNITNHINNIPDLQVRRALQAIFTQLVTDMNLCKTAFAAHTHVYGKPRIFTPGTFAVKATADPDIKTSTTIFYQSANSAMKSISSGNIDVSAIAGYTPVAQATGQQRYYLITINTATDAIGCTEGVNHASAAVLPATPAGHIAVGWFKVVNASAGNFTFGTTNVDTAGLTVTAGDLARDEANGMLTSGPDGTAAGFTQVLAKAFTQTLTV
jgi:hypothetical protein